MKSKFIALACLMLPLAARAQITMNIDATQRGPELSPYQYGLFFEEINNAGDGGLYAELVHNRSFEDNSRNPDHWWALNGASMALVTNNLLNSAQQHALRISTTSASASSWQGVYNEGYWGMDIRKDSTYTLSFWAKGSNAGYTGKLRAQLQSADGSKVLASANIEGTVSTSEWTRLTVTLRATATGNGRLALLTSNNGKLYVDVVSLFPYTWKGRPNGLRPQLAQLLADTHPKFLRFPGGCFVEGYSNLGNAFQWKNTIGPIEQRPGHNGHWGYHVTDGLGFDEFLQLCNDLGAAPLFVVNVGLGHGYTIPLEQTDTLVQNALDAIEYANGDSTTYWGARRIANGHKQPYNLKFIEIGNENYQADASLQSQDYAERYYKFYKAIKQRYPDIITIGNVEAWGTDNPSWRNPYPVEVMDEHYYRSYAWMRANYNKYDNYDRNTWVYNGEYAANEGGTYGQYGNMNSALGEAVYMLGMERNSDVARMASFAPIFINANNNNWAYDMIHFNASSTFCTPSYYVQKMLGQNAAGQNLKWTETGNSTIASQNRMALGSWNTQVSYDDVQLTDSAGNSIMSDDFSTTASWTDGNGSWNTDGQTKNQTAQGTPCLTVSNAACNTDNYTLRLRARKNGGSEGFLIAFKYANTDNLAWWNIGGWGNTQHAIENCVDGTKSTIAAAAGSVETGRWYNITIKVAGQHVQCWLDNTLVHDATLPASSNRAVYQSVQLNADTLVLKVVNPYDTARTIHLNLKNMKATGGLVLRYAATAGTDENTMEQPGNVLPSAPQQLSNTDSVVVPPFSLNIFKLNVRQVADEVKPDLSDYTREDSAKTGYLYAHMNEGEYTAYALSRNGQYWHDLLNGAEVFSTKKHTTTGGMRDAYITRMHNGGFMLAGTDMRSALGWTSNHIMDLMLSPDLVHWTKEVKIDLESSENLKALGLDNADQLTAAWAPQVIYDPESGHYMVYYSVGKTDRHRIYYQLVDDSLNVLTKPRLLFDPGYDVIDADITWNAVDKKYIMIYKHEGVFDLLQARANHLVPAAGENQGTCQWTIQTDFKVRDGGQAIEAPSLYRPIGSTNWHLGYMNYSGAGHGYKFRRLDEHSLNPSDALYIQGTVSAQHGSFVKLTEEEYQMLEHFDSVQTLLPTARQYYEQTHSDAIARIIAEAEAALDSSTTFSANAEAMARAAAHLHDMQTIYRNTLLDEVRQGNPANLTPLIVNAGFSERGKGWTTSTAFTQANGYVAEFWNTAFRMQQTIDSVPDGYYEVGVQSFYREGSIDNAVNLYRNGRETHPAMLFANDDATPVMSLYAVDSVYTLSPYNFPDNVTTANAAFNEHGMYHNTLVAHVTGGSITFGLYKDATVNSDWCCFDNFTLKYLGRTLGISGVHGSNAVSTRMYDLQGRQVTTRLPHQIVIQQGRKSM